MAPLRIGISLTTAYPARLGAREGGQRLVERTRAARRAELDSLFVGDHHNTGPSLYYQNLPTMGRLLAEWGEAPAGILALLPLWHPVLLAEQLGTLASFAAGRLIVQVSLGDGPEQFGAMGVDRRRRVALFERHLTTIRALLAGDEVDGVRIAPIPEEPVEFWLGGMADAALARAARMCEGFLATPGCSVERAGDVAGRYRVACTAAGRDPAAVAIRRDVFVGANAEDARRVTAPLLAAGYRGFSPDVLVIGSAEQVAESFAALRDTGYTDVIVRHLALEQSDVVASTERLAEVKALLA